MARELRSAYAAAEADEAVWTLLITATGRAFCTGADVEEIPEDGRVIYDEPYLSTYPQWEAPKEGTPPFRTMTKPTVVAVNGLCCGAGLDLVTQREIGRQARRETLCQTVSFRLCPVSLKTKLQPTNTYLPN